MTGYGDLADKLNTRRSNPQPAHADGPAPQISAAEVYEHVKLLVGREVDKANVELRKRQLATIERVFLPSYRGKLCLTYGSELFCTVALDETKKQISAAITGPPHGSEIARKDFTLGGDFSPEKASIEIVSGLLEGAFS